MRIASYIDEFDTLLHTDIDAIRRHVAAFRQRQLISILVPVGNAPVDYLKSSVQSVLDQAYENWQLCIAADGSASDEVVSYLKSLPSMEGRVKIVFLETGGRTAAALNNALEMAAGEFSVILYPGDLLSVHSLYFISLKINESSGLNIIYSDEDEIDSHGVRSNARFKSGWNPDLFLSHDMISRLAAYKTSLLRGIGGFRVEFEGGQDYDLALRCVNGSDSVQIAHVSRVLYHRRQENESALGDFHAQDQACLARERALSDFLKDQPGVVVSRGSLAGTFRVNYPVPTPAPKVSVIIPTRDGGPLLKKCIQSVLHETEYENIELIVVDNQSEGDETVAYLRLLEGRADVKVLRYDFPFNYSSINNFAAKHASGEILCFLNDDVEATRPDWLKEMVSHALRPEIGVVGAKLLYADNFIQHAGVVIGIGGFAGHAHRLYPATHPGYAGRAVLTQNLSAVTGACLVMRGKLFADIGGFDEKNLPVAFNDVDLCLRVREAGYRVLWTPHAVLYHYESYSRGDDQASPEKRARFNREKDFMVARWNVSNFNDPYYNGNLTLDREDFSFANFPRINNPWRDFARV
jgi:GT2 family glycosyltransferase